MTAPLTLLSEALRDGRLGDRDAAFGADLVRASMTPRGLSPKQAWWVEKLVERAQPRAEPQAQGTAIRGAVAEIFSLFERASANGLAWPKIHLEAEDGTPVRFSRAGERSKYCGQIQLTDGGHFGNNRYFGRIDAAGVLYDGRDLTASVKRLVENFAADPAGVAALYGRRTGSCCFCHRDLSTAESLAVGYGPVCAQKFGLAWGSREASPLTTSEAL